MLIPVPSEYRKRRGRPKPSRLPPTPPPAGLEVVSIIDASSGGADLVFTAVFNTTEAGPLNDVSMADAAKWVARFDGQRYIGSALELIAFDQILVVAMIDVAEAGPNEVAYTNAPSDIFDALGRSLAAFSLEF